MIRKLKTLGILLGAVLATGAIAVPVASAQFEFESAPTTLTTSSNQMVKFAPSEGSTAIECTSKSNKGSVSVTVTVQVTVSGSFGSCETFLGAATSVNTNGCKFVFHLAKGSTSGTTDISCETGKSIEITIGSICKYTIGSQSGLGSVGFKNTGSGTTREIVVEPQVKGIAVTRATNDLFCPAGGTTGTYTGTETLTGESSGGAHIGSFVD